MAHSSGVLCGQDFIMTEEQRRVQTCTASGSTCLFRYVLHAETLRMDSFPRAFFLKRTFAIPVSITDTKAAETME